MSHLTTHPETEALVLPRDTSNHSYCSDAKWFTKLYGLLFNLLCQLTSGSQDDSVWSLIRVLNSAENKTNKALLSGVNGRKSDARKEDESSELPVNFWQGGNPDKQWNQESGSFTTTCFCHTNDVPIL